MDKQTITIGLPRALLYYRYYALWRTFFQELGMEVAVSAPTDRDILDRGAALAIDEACLSLKIYLGHVAALVGKCDYILVPRVSNFGRQRSMCTRFESTPDLVRGGISGLRPGVPLLRGGRGTEKDRGGRVPGPGQASGLPAQGRAAGL